MQKVLYSGAESGLFIEAALYNYIEGLKTFSKIYDERDKHVRIIGWKSNDKNLNLEFIRRNLNPSRGEITFNIIGEDIGEFERILLKEHQERLNPVKA